MRLLSGSISLVVVYALGFAATPARADSKDLPNVELNASSFAGTYSQTSTNSLLGGDDVTPSTKLTGTSVIAAATIQWLHLDLGSASYKAKESDSYYKTRSDTFFDAGVRMDPVPWLIPTFGYYSSTQTSDRTLDSAPLSFIDKTALMLYGLQTEFVPFTVDGHGMIIKLRYAYLTSGEAKNNFGDMRLFEAGYVYKAASFEIGVRGGISRTFLNAQRTQKKTFSDGTTIDVTRSVRSIVQGNLITFFVEY